MKYLTFRFPWSLYLAPILTLTTINALPKSAINCPSTCSCNKAVIKCTEAWLSSIPEFKKVMLHPVTLDLSGNEIEEVKMANFYSKRLETLQHLLLSDNSIYLVEVTAFMTLPKLQTLDLSENLLEDLPRDVLLKNSNLTKLNLSGNLFNPKPPELISSSLEVLDLSVCKITSISDVSLQGLPNLRILYLQANNLKYLDYDIFVNTKLKQINLLYNPWKCNCDTIKLFNYVINNDLTELDKTVQCMHDSKWYEDLYNAKGPLYEKKLCKINDDQAGVYNDYPTKSIDVSHFNNKEDINAQNESGTNFNVSQGVFIHEIIIICTVILVLLLISLISLIVIQRRLKVNKHFYAEVNSSFRNY